MPLKPKRSPEAPDREPPRLDDGRIAEFISAAAAAGPLTPSPTPAAAPAPEPPPPPPAPAPRLPWLDPRVREDVALQLNTRIPEPLALKLDYLSRETRTSKQALVIEALQSYLARELRRLGLPPG